MSMEREGNWLWYVSRVHHRRKTIVRDQRKLGGEYWADRLFRGCVCET